MKAKIIETKFCLKRQDPPIVHEVFHFKRKRLIDLLISQENPNGKYFIPLSFEGPAYEGFVPIHAIYIDSKLLEKKPLNLEDVRDKSCTLVTNYTGVSQDDIVPHLYDFLATGEEVARNVSVDNLNKR